MSVSKERFDQASVLHAGRAGGFATATVQAQVQMPRHRVAERNPSIRYGPHQVDAAAGTIVLVAGFKVRRAGRGAETAMDAVEELVVIDRASSDRETLGQRVFGGGGHGCVLRRLNSS